MPRPPFQTPSVRAGRKGWGNSIAEVSGADSGVYLIKDTTDLLNPVIRYYNEKGELLLTQKGAAPSLTPVLDNNTDTALFSEVDPDTTQLVYYRLTY